MPDETPRQSNSQPKKKFDVFICDTAAAPEATAALAADWTSVTAPLLLLQPPPHTEVNAAFD